MSGIYEEVKGVKIVIPRGDSASGPVRCYYFTGELMQGARTRGGTSRTLYFKGGKYYERKGDQFVEVVISHEIPESLLQ